MVPLYHESYLGSEREFKDNCFSAMKRKDFVMLRVWLVYVLLYSIDVSFFSDTNLSQNPLSGISYIINIHGVIDTMGIYLVSLHVILILRRETHVSLGGKKKWKSSKLPTVKHFNINLNRINIWKITDIKYILQENIFYCVKSYWFTLR